ncbi:MAG: hypothetical protein ABSF93_22050 [Candidatus Sulfotelmatobacter sp.]|jgi:hypothetical protein
MPDPRPPLPAKQTLLLILLPMLATAISLRLYLHLVHVRHIYPGGYLVHHLFVGLLIQVPAAFLLAFGTRYRVLARVALGIGSGLILDEFVYLVATKASDADYVSRPSLVGAIILVSLAVIFLFVLYALHRDET